MTAAFQQLIAEQYPPLARSPRRRLRTERRAQQIRLAMRRIRQSRRRAGLNNSGKPLKPVNRKFINKKYRKRYAT